MSTPKKTLKRHLDEEDIPEIGRISAGPFFKKQEESTNGKSLSPTKRLLIFLHTAHRGDDVSNAGSQITHNISAGVHCESMKMSIDCLFEELVKKERLIKCPNGARAKVEAQLFEEHANYPCLVWACLDGTYIIIKCPQDL